MRFLSCNEGLKNSTAQEGKFFIHLMRVHIASPPVQPFSIIITWSHMKIEAAMTTSSLHIASPPVQPSVYLLTSIHVKHNESIQI
ncbi:hypothetical protein C1H46_039970 [Malus baccata]|uniref:Uncharacterized protein n=1 Tax=Malus baccata TaxID=106549 RepID=A0A540KJY7_MALBA|nr:hypothetical protein C1H46_039970 [Malus baccata]